MRVYSVYIDRSLKAKNAKGRDEWSAAVIN